MSKMERLRYLNGTYLNDNSIILSTINKKKERKSIKIVGFEPYFYVKRNATIPRNQSIKRVERDAEFPPAYVTKHKTTDVVKIVAKSPPDIPKIRSSFSKHWEGKVPYVARLLIDTGIFSYFKIPKGTKTIHYKRLKAIKTPKKPFLPNTTVIDIEVDTDDRFESATKARKPITAVSFKIDAREKFETIMLDEMDAKTVVNENWTIIHVTSERKLLRYCKKYIDLIIHHAITGWNVYYDIDYIKNRGKLYNIYFNFYRFCIYDLYDLYSTTYKKLGNRLKEVVIHEKLTKAEDMVASEFHKEYWKNPKLRLKHAEYNKDDVKYPEMINKKHELNIHAFYLQSTAGLQRISDVTLNSMLIDSLLLRLFHGRKIFPTKEKHKHVGFKGATSHSTIGIFFGVSNLDLSRYYPNIIKALNLSEESVALVDYLMKARDHYEDILKTLTAGTDEFNSIKHQRDGVKFCLNAVYGWRGSPYCRIPDEEEAGRVTEVGREGVKRIREHTRKEGYRDLASDTDSSLTKIPMEEVKSLVISINKMLNEWCLGNGWEPDMEIKEDKYYRKVIFTRNKGKNRGARKRRAGHVIRENGKEVDYIEIIGFDAIRRDNSEKTKEIQKHIMEYMLRNDKDVKIYLRKYLRKQVTLMKKGKFSVDEIAIKKTVKKKLTEYKANTPFVRGSKYANEHMKIGIEKGDMVKMLPIKRILQKGKPQTDWICFFDPHTLPKMEIDYNILVEKTIKMKVETLIELFALKWNDVLFNQKTLKELLF